MRRLRVGVAYWGEAFSGFTKTQQDKTTLPSIQDVIEHSLSQIGEFTSFQVSSRTDKGVHALRNVFHVDVNHATLGPDGYQRALNYHLTNNSPARGNVAVTDVTEVSAATFDARRSCTGRTYLYRLLENSTPAQDVFFRGRTAWVLHRPLNVEAMQHSAATLLMGEQDHASFQNAGCQSKSSFRNITEFRIERQKEGQEALFPDASLVNVTVSANAFLLRQVRNMVGCLVEVGLGRLSHAQLAEIVQARSRDAMQSKRIRPAPACGLYLQKVSYLND